MLQNKLQEKVLTRREAQLIGLGVLAAVFYDYQYLAGSGWVALALAVGGALYGLWYFGRGQAAKEEKTIARIDAALAVAGLCVLTLLRIPYTNWLVPVVAIPGTCVGLFRLWQLSIEMRHRL